MARFTVAAAVLAFLALGCDTSMLGGGKTIQIGEQKLPAPARVAFNESHPNTPILRVEEVLSNGPPLYSLHYRARGGDEEIARYAYSPNWFPERDVYARFEQDHPNAGKTTTEQFIDYEKKTGWNVIHFDSDTGPSEAKYEFSLERER
jgi:hypothetical protein